MSYPIPKEALDDRLVITGTSGSGKTYMTLGAMARLMETGARVVGVDPLGVMWGLRLLADGKSSGFDVVIFGGPHGDLPINENSGALIGEAVAGMRESCILDLSELGTPAKERRFMLAFLTAMYRKVSKDPVHLIVDEADMWAPQVILDRDGDAAKLLGMMQTVVRRGRVKGFIPWLITQRPAELSKGVLSMADGVVAFAMTSGQDRDAVGIWIKGQADVATGKEILASLPSMRVGQGVVWIPRRGVLKRDVQFPENKTFDSSRAPKRGEKKRTASLKPLDLTKLRGQLATVEAEAAANDPAALRREVTRLTAELAKAGKSSAVPSAGHSQKALDTAVAAARAAGVRDGVQFGWTAAIDVLRPVVSAAGQKLVMDFEAAGKRVPSPPKSLVDTDKLITTSPPAPQQASRGPARPAVAVLPPPSDAALGAERKPLAALVQVYPAGMTEAQWAVSAGIKRTGGTWAAYKSRLKSAGRIEQRGDLFFATEVGIADAGDSVPALPPPGMELVEFWIGKISGIGPMLRALAESYPRKLTREELGAQINVATSGGTFAAYLSRLKSPGLITVDKDGVRASDALMVG